MSTHPVLGFSEIDLERRQFLGVGGDMKSGFVDNEVAPTNGFLLGANLKFLKSLQTEEDVTNWGVNAQAYLTLLTRPQIVLANNIGYEQVLGEPQFYQYADLGNTTNLRGFRNNRFRGETAFYHNIDLRIRLAQWDNRVLPMDVGILTGYDYGRVGIDDIDSDIWHNSQTVGVWFNILGLAVLQPYYSFTDEENTFTFKMGFNF